ncbi:aminodeoxychorismate synthase, component I [Candidatus Desantisbacteria bacterium CG_4_10_14_0_8_um_filter_48_22]|uniref:aminodeoxychorismate synthase n=1 Tax=Candidatus Desantisbacteria bacterium CG_4_10_14_0_8_um_filter_48_22 TaxID=1974543 RepID=A0A2M7S8V2_9BACT|nr:MAG: aminodeoxychorismate synthase, component I [Candidatus Desantisbacteria bacterium CG1_02_49_89]PIV55704.1 MAG: aminodeoxychorismate synthase, component I [Candidatus Desantisbacteria bacterium CG02_land_8_20_14_3_00_49_13]PIZ15944.1 MAG: aminodeoxychorismate synthase, component I [Candidatus Desantisbacteria bacterium CG_4_10_14_0_8_um_filter_48_22]PJB27982.1 MAG: aminodeoxychorismate synthase, component I [Candidatus Desantisbacteria bacterium CG_4_9_14_3_um_filter_50_7]
MKIIEITDLKLTPVQAFERVFKDKPYPFLLESGMPNLEYGRYSIMGSDPFLKFISKGRRIEIVKNGRTRHLKGNPFDLLKDLLRRLPPKETGEVFEKSAAALKDCKAKALPYDVRCYDVTTHDARPPFTGGAVGYFAYDLGWHVEKLPNIAKDDINLPDCYLCFYNQGMVFDNFKKKAYIFGINRDWLTSTQNRIKETNKADTKSQKELKRHIKSGRLTSNFTYSGYVRAIKRAKHYISIGDIYQANLSQRFMCHIDTHPFELFKRLRNINPACFSAYLDYGTFSIVSSSPELFLRVRDRDVQTRPIKGTRPRGRTPAEDRKLADELMASRKDRAELVMIVDLERNDLGRVCDYGTVRVKEPVRLEKLPTVFHTVSTVEGKLYKGKGVVDLLMAAFPGGSITGAPKIRAMEIIEELEPTKRNVYTGAIGYLGFNNSADLNIAIRTFVIKGRKAYFQAGGGIVADSDPRKEYRETLDKARALIKAVKG